MAAQNLGLNTCWVAFCARKKSKAVCGEGQKVRIVISVGYGKIAGHERPTKSIEQLSTVEGSQPAPSWFACAMEAVQLAPTAMNNQHFTFTLRADGRTVAAKAPSGTWDTVDLGIAKCHFVLIADELNVDWAWE